MSARARGVGHSGRSARAKEGEWDEVDDEEGYYEVEVILDNGDHVDVHLDEGFNLLGTENDGPDDAEDDGDED